MSRSWLCKLARMGESIACVVSRADVRTGSVGSGVVRRCGRASRPPCCKPAWSRETVAVLVSRCGRKSWPRHCKPDSSS